MLTADVDHYRRIFPDRCDWPKGIEPTNQGYSIGRRIAEDGDGRYDRREVATRGFKGPRCCAASGLPLHFDDQSVFKEPIHLDRTDPHLIDDEIADPPLTRPRTDKKYVRARDPEQQWPQYVCGEGNLQVIGDQHDVISGRIVDANSQKPTAARSVAVEAQVRR